jgi:poly(3-hydroxyalkanoate) synthetase
MCSQALRAWLALPSFNKPSIFNHWQRWLKVHPYL